MLGQNHNIINVSDNKEKQAAYTANWVRYNKAIKSEFYFEAIWILYAIAEDRSSAFFRHLGFVTKSNRKCVVRKYSRNIRIILNLKPDKKGNYKYGFGNFGTKIDNIQTIMEWSNKPLTNDFNDKNEKYWQTIHKALLPLNNDVEFLHALKYLKGDWREKRNQLIHALLNKNDQAVIPEIKVLAEEGYIAVRKLDNAIKRIKSKNICKKFNIQ